MSNPRLDFNGFVNLGALDPNFLLTYARDPDRLTTRFDIADDLIDKIKSSQDLLELIATANPTKMAEIARRLRDLDPVAAFGDHRDGSGYSDKFKDGGGFSDRYDNVK